MRINEYEQNRGLYEEALVRQGATLPAQQHLRASRFYYGRGIF